MGAQTGLVMKCHRSNFEITGFTEEAPGADLVALCRKKECVFVEDLGSGALIDLAEFNLKQEPTVSDVIGQGVDLVMFSGDKLMGGSQAGVICGKCQSDQETACQSYVSRFKGGQTNDRVNRASADCVYESGIRKALIGSAHCHRASRQRA